jgi:CIC family chloride channel protein
VASGSPSPARVAEHSTLFGLAIGVGLLAGLVAVAFQEALAYAAGLRLALSRDGALSTGGIAAAVLFSALAVWAGVAIVRRFAPETGGSGIPLVEAALHKDRDLKWPRILWVKFTGGVLAIGGGLTLGREGTTVLMGAALGRALGGAPSASDERRRTLIAAGAGAGLAAAFNAPLAGTVFVLEEMRVLRTPRHALAALLASVTADQVYRGLLGGAPQLGAVAVSRPPLAALVPLLILGAAAGVLGAIFNRCLLGTLALFDRLRSRDVRWAGGLSLLVGAAVGVVGFFAPLVLGPGDGLIEQSLRAPLDAASAAAVFVARFALTLASYGTGASGGLFAPLLVLGAEGGVLVGRAADPLFPVGEIALPVFAIVGMGALFAGSVRAPATGVLLMIEMTGALHVLLPLVYAAILADLTARALGARPIYEALLERTLRREERVRRS